MEIYQFQLHDSKYEMDFSKIQDDENIRDVLLKKASLREADLIIVGYHGRKGPKRYFFLFSDVTIMG